MRLSDAIQIGLDNHERICVVSLRQPIPVFNCFGPPPESTPRVRVSAGFPSGRVILTDHPHCRAERRGSPDVIGWPPNIPGEATEQLRSEAEKVVRLVERRYWILAQKHVELWLADHALERFEGILQIEGARRAGQGAGRDPALVAHVEQALEQCRARRFAKTRGVLTAERRFREVLGLPPKDNRRIIPVTMPAAPNFDARWDHSVAQMLSSQPDVVARRNQLVGASLRFLAIRGTALIVSDGALGSTRRPLQAETAQALAELKDRRVRYREAVRLATDRLSRSIKEAESAGRQLARVIRLSDDSRRALAEEQKSFEAGRITADRYQEAMAHFARAERRKTQVQTDFQDSIAAFEQAKGTLLAFDNITLLNESSTE